MAKKTGRYIKTQMMRVSSDFATAVHKVANRDDKTATDVTRELAEMLTAELEPALKE
jgi:hypothetical protein